MLSEQFYTELAAVKHFASISNLAHYTPVPDDWLIVISDVVNSSLAVEHGSYRAVNFIGAASIIALLNIEEHGQLPFVFGGDGSSVLIPPSFLPAAQASLQELQVIAQNEYQLELRVGIVPVREIRRAGFDLLVLKIAQHEHYAQAMFHGGGLLYAERLIKHPQYGEPFRLEPAAPFDTPSHLNLSGLECRWQEVLTPYEEHVTLLIASTHEPGYNPLLTYQTVLEQLQQAYGKTYAPVTQERLRLSLDPRRLWVEARLRAQWKHISPLRALWQIWLITLLGRILIHYGVQTSDTDWKQYRQHVQASTDYQKYDDMLRMVIAGTRSQRRQFQSWLDQQQQAGILAYGIHVSSRVVLTCLVFERMGQQVHFVDGADGGYTRAAQVLKERLRSYTLIPMV